MPASARTASNASVKCPARSRTRNRKSAARSPYPSEGCALAASSTARPGTPSRQGHAVPGADLDHEEAVQALQGHRAVHVEEVNREHRGCLGVQELPPGDVGAPPGCRRDLQGLEDPADGGCADPVADLEQLTLDPLVAPAVVLGGEPLDQRGNLSADRRPSRTVRIGPLAGDQAAVPAQVGAGGDQPVRSQPCRQEPDQRGEDRPVGPAGRGRGFARRSTATSCRSTSSSASLKADDRPSRTSQPQSRTKMR